MISISATEVRKDFSAVIDKAIHEKPVFIRRTRDQLMLADVRFLAALVEKCTFTAERFTEEDGSITLSLQEIDLAVNAPTEREAVDALASDIIEYAYDYYDHFEVWSKAPNRADHLPHVMKAIISNDQKEIGALITCRAGAT